MHYDMLLFAKYILTQNSTREVQEDACLAIAQGKVAALGPAASFEQCTASTTLHLEHTLLMPGLVNAHTHAAMTYLRGMADDLPLMDWLTNYIFPVEKHLTEEIVEIGTLLGCAEMLATGTTACQDMYLLTQAACKAMGATGIKARVGEGIFSFPSPAYATQEEAFALLEQQVQQWQGHERVRLVVAPHSVYTTTAPLLERCLAFARQHDLPLHIHLAETATETAQSLEMHGMRPVAYAEHLGLLAPGTSIAHGVALLPDEIALLARQGVCVVHNPKSNMKLASGVAPVPAMLVAGVPVALGTDGAASNNALNMFAEMNACALLHKAVCQNPTLVPAQAVLDMATLGGATALAWQGLGCLHPGGPADVIALDMRRPNMQPCFTPVSQVVYAASGHEVCLTVVDGRIVYQDGRYTTIDYPVLLQEMQGLVGWVRKKQRSLSR